MSDFLQDARSPSQILEHLGSWPISLDELRDELREPDARLIVAKSSVSTIGIKRFEPGEAFENHYHQGYDEIFVGLSGTITIWQGRALASKLIPGTSLVCHRGSHHALVNTSSEPAVLMFIKTGGVTEDDTVWVHWDTPRTDEH